MRQKEIDKLQKRIVQIKKRLSELGDMRPGSLSMQYNVCGNPTCRCKHPEKPVKHGPYYQISYTRKGRSTSEFVKTEKVLDFKQQLKNYQTFKKLIDEWVELSLLIAKLKKLL
jgi:hypothetical protein